MRRTASALIAGLSLLAVSAGAAGAQTAGSTQVLGNSVGGANPTSGQQGLPTTQQGATTPTGAGANNPADALGGLGGPTGGEVDTTQALGSALSSAVLGGSNSGNGLPMPQGANPEDWGLEQGVGGPIVLAGDLALKSRGYEGGLAAQGIDTGQITGPLGFKDVMPAGAADQVSAAMGTLNGILGAN